VGDCGMAAAVTGLRFVPLDPGLAERIAPWFDDPATQRFLGDRQWIKRELRLIHDMPRQRHRGLTITGRWGWVVFEGPEPVAFVGTERNDDRTASASLVVAPERRGRRIGRRAIVALLEQPEVEGVIRLLGSIDPDNVASIRCLIALGVGVPADADDEGMLTFDMPVSRHASRA